MGIEQSPFALHRGRQGRTEVQTLDEGCVGPYEDVARGREPPEGLIGPGASPEAGGDLVADDHEQIVIAVRAGCAARARAEEIDTLGPIGLDEAPRDLGEGRVVGRYGTLAVGLRGIARHGGHILAVKPRPEKQPTAIQRSARRA